jgi:septal ring factor EnvC (AmiA/AmiB activator)
MDAQERFVLLEEKVTTLLTSAKRLKEDNVQLKQKNSSLQEQVREQEKSLAEMVEVKNNLKQAEDENLKLMEEREEIKKRVEALITQLESFEMPEMETELLDSNS